jgi:hypothetical protein
MIEHRPFNELGGEDHGWLKAKHHFSFAEDGDPARMGWGSLRVWNNDEIAPNKGFPPHPHANMEIITYVREGAVTHKDSLGNEGRTEAGAYPPHRPFNSILERGRKRCWHSNACFRYFLRYFSRLPSNKFSRFRRAFHWFRSCWLCYFRYSGAAGMS